MCCPCLSVRRSIFCLVLFFILLLLPLLAAARPITLETVTVTAERFPIKEKDAARFVTVITGEELVQSGANNVVDALKRKGGFAYKAYAPLGISHGGMNSELPVRGLEGGELVLINGVPIQSAAGHGYDLNTIPVDLIARVEILKGAASTLYGADAMTGVINIITRQPVEVQETRVSVEVGNEGYHNHTVSYLSPTVSACLNYQHLGDQTEISRSFSKKYRYDLAETDKYALSLNCHPFEKVNVDYLGSFYETGFEKVYDDPSKAFEGTSQKHYKNFLDLRYDDENFKAKVFGIYDEMQREEYTAEEPDDENKNYNFGFEGDYRFDWMRLQWVVGADGVHRAADYNNQYGYHCRNDYAVFAEVKKEFIDRLAITVGIREQFIDGESGAKDYDRFLPSFGARCRITEALNIFANAGKAFRAPTFNNLYYQSSFLVGNPDLDPEEGWTYEVGAKWDTDRVRLRVAAFHMAYENKIETDRTRGYPLSYYNAGDYATTGMEWELDLFPFSDAASRLSDVSFYTSGYWSDPTADDTDGNSHQAGPRSQIRTGICCTSQPLTLDVNCLSLLSRERNLDGYAVLNVFGKVRLGKGHATLSIDNLLNEEVQVSGDLTASGSNRYAYYELGRLVKIGYAIAF